MNWQDFFSKTQCRKLGLKDDDLARLPFVTKQMRIGRAGKMLTVCLYKKGTIAEVLESKGMPVPNYRIK